MNSNTIKNKQQTLFRVLLLLITFVFIDLLILTNHAHAQQPTGEALYFSGVGGPQIIPDSSIIEYDGDTIAFETWIYPCDVSALSILGKQWCTTNTEYIWSINAGRLRWGWSKNGGCDSTNGYYAMTTNAVVPTGQWTHLAVVHSRSNIRFWINGVMVNPTDVGYYTFTANTNVPEPSNPAEFNIHASTHQLQIGAYRRWDGVQTAIPEAFYDQIAMWNTLPPSLATRTTTELDRNASGLIFYLDMETHTNAGTANHFIMDASPNGLDARRENGGPYTSGSVFPFPGTYDYLGNDTFYHEFDSIQIGGSTGIPPGASFLWSTGETTASIWVDNMASYWRTVFWGNCSFTDTIFVAGPLAVEMTFFDAIGRNQVVDLDWQTASESNHRHFEVERSADGKNFDQLGIVDAFGNSQELRDYRFTDYEPLDGMAWYRLRMVDFDGAFEYSDVRLVNRALGETLQFELYPNPASDVVHIFVQNAADQSLQVQLTDLSGRVIRSWSREAGEVGTFDLSLDGIAQGMYLVQGKSGGKRFTKKLIVK